MALQIIGAGGIGCTLAAALADAGCQPMVVETRMDKIRWAAARGIVVQERRYQKIPVVAFQDWQPTAGDTVLLCVKCYDNAAVLQRLPDTVDLIPVQNGYDPLLESRSHEFEAIASFVAHCTPATTQVRITRPGMLHFGPRISGHQSGSGNQSNSRKQKDSRDQSDSGYQSGSVFQSESGHRSDSWHQSVTENQSDSGHQSGSGFQSASSDPSTISQLECNFKPIGSVGDRGALFSGRLALAKAFASSSLFRFASVPDIRPIKAAKLMYNAAISPLAAAAGMDNGELLTHVLARRLFFMLLRENYAILRAAGVPLGKVGPFHPRTVNRILHTPGLARFMARFFIRSLRGTYCSMAGDLATGRTELDYYTGHLLRLAKGRLAAPVNQAVMHHVAQLRGTDRLVLERIASEIKLKL